MEDRITSSHLFTVSDIYERVKDTRPVKEPKIQCKYVYVEGHQCKTYLNFSSRNSGKGLCQLHSNKDHGNHYALHWKVYLETKTDA